MYDIWGVFMEKISIIVPVYNEIDTLDKIVEKIENARFCGLEKEIIFVDDSSFDGSTDLLKKYESRLPFLTLCPFMYIITFTGGKFILLIFRHHRHFSKYLIE